MKCADCGAEVELRRGRWAEPVPGAFGFDKGKAWSFVCRTRFEDNRLVAADYHYVEGEQQRHFPIPEE